MPVKSVRKRKPVKKKVSVKRALSKVIEYRRFGDSYYLTTDLLLKGRGIKMADNGRNHKRGKKTYHATLNAFKVLKEKYSVVLNTKGF